MVDLIKYEDESDWDAFTECMCLDIVEEGDFRDYLLDNGYTVDSLTLSELEVLYKEFDNDGF